MDCPHCQSQQVVKNGREPRPNEMLMQRYRCRDCGKQFNERTGTPIARLRAPSSVVAMALNSRTEGMGARATGRTFGKSHSTILRWEERLANQVNEWSPPAPADREVAQNAALRRRCSAYRGRQNLYAKTRSGLQRVLDVQRIIHDWVRPHWGLGKRTTPAMAIGLCSRPLSTQEILCMRGFQCISS